MIVIVQHRGEEVDLAVSVVRKNSSDVCRFPFISAKPSANLRRLPMPALIAVDVDPLTLTPAAYAADRRLSA